MDMSANTTGQKSSNRRAARIVTTTLVAGGIALAGGTAYANSGFESESGSTKDLPTAAGIAAAAADPTQVNLQAFTDAGYTFDDAVVLGQQWNQEPFDAKVRGGEKLLAGETLPIAPGSSAPSAPVDEPAAQEAAAIDAFFAAGYIYDDAVALGQTWNVEPYQAKVCGGQELTAGQTLPIAVGTASPAAPVAEAPTSQVTLSTDAVAKQIAAIKAATRSVAARPITPVAPVAAASTLEGEAAAEAFFAAGYTYDDAVALASTWNVGSYEAKVLGGQKLSAGETLPIAAGSATPAPVDPATATATAEAAAVDAFFNAGYTFDDAVTLGNTWNVEPYQAKVTGGRKLLAGETLPVAP